MAIQRFLVGELNTGHVSCLIAEQSASEENNMYHQVAC